MGTKQNGVFGILYKLRDIMEIIVPSISFAVTFVVFVAQVLSRYVLKHPLTWAYEITVWGFAWTVVLGACYAMRTRGHVTFTMIYDTLPRRIAVVLRLLGNVMVIVGLAILIIPSCHYLQFVTFQKTSAFRIPVSVLFCPFVYFLCSVIGYTVTDVVAEVKYLMGKSESEEASK